MWAHVSWLRPIRIHKVQIWWKMRKEVLLPLLRIPIHKQATSVRFGPTQIKWASESAARRSLELGNGHMKRDRLIEEWWPFMDLWLHLSTFIPMQIHFFRDYKIIKTGYLLIPKTKMMKTNSELHLDHWRRIRLPGPHSDWHYTMERTFWSSVTWKWWSSGSWVLKHLNNNHESAQRR